VLGQHLSKCREDQVACRIPAPDAGPRIEGSGNIELMEGNDASRPHKARGCAEEIGRIGLMDQHVSTNDAVKEIGVGKAVERDVFESDLS
jgi:hypothetical protein